MNVATVQKYNELGKLLFPDFQDTTDKVIGIEPGGLKGDYTVISVERMTKEDYPREYQLIYHFTKNSAEGEWFNQDIESYFYLGNTLFLFR